MRIYEGSYAGFNLLDFVEDADVDGFFDFRKPNGEVSHSFPSGKLNAFFAVSV